MAVEQGSGTVEIDGVQVPVSVYERQQWGQFGYTLYQALAVEADRLHVLWFYCRDGALTDVWIESTDGNHLVVESASGSCTESDAPSEVTSSFPAVEMEVPPLVGGFTLTGPDVEIDGAQPGLVRVGGSEFDVYVFGHVDCTQDCGTPGWHELHALVWDGDAQWLCVGIFYLFLDDRAPQLSYTFSLPVLAEPFGTTVLTGAAWTS